mgnify:CR=1 FL=1
MQKTDGLGCKALNIKAVGLPGIFSILLIYKILYLPCIHTPEAGFLPVIYLNRKLLYLVKLHEMTKAEKPYGF